MKISNLGLLPKIIIAIILGIICSLFFPVGVTRVFATFNGIFGNFLGFIIPLLIFGLVAPGIAELGKGAGRLLLITAGLAYGFTIFSGFMSYTVTRLSFPIILGPDDKIQSVGDAANTFEPFFTIEMAPVMGVMSALVAAFVVGLGLAYTEGKTLQGALSDFKGVIEKVITGVIIPLLPLYIFGIFLIMSQSGEVTSVLSVFMKIIVIIFAMTAVLLLLQYFIAGAIAKKNPIRLLRTMLPAYATALGTSSSAATIPVTLAQTLKNDVDEDIAGFVVPLCATIHLSGSTLKIVSCALAIMMMTGMPIDFVQFAGFIFMLGVTMVAAPGVPGGAIVAALGILGSILGFSKEAQALMIALYIAMDSFGTACNVTGDGAIAVIVNVISGKKRGASQTA